MPTYYTVLTKKGQEKLTAAIALGNTIQLTRFEIGDGGGSVYKPTADHTQLVHTVYGALPNAAPINSISQDQNKTNWLVIECIIPEDIGGFTVRELGIFDSDDELFAIANYPETYKPSLVEGSAQDFLIRTILEVANTDSVELSIDPSIVLASRDYVDRNTLTEKAIRTYVEDMLIGVVASFATSTLPDGWLECDGQAIYRTQYAKLFARIGIKFGVGDGVSTFNVPNLQGEFIRGWDNGRGIDVGRSFGSWQVDELQSHGHIEGGSGHIHSGSTTSAGDHYHGMTDVVTIVTSQTLWH